MPLRRLNEMETMHFISLYKKARVLWDRNHILYNNKSARENAYGIIISRMGMEMTMDDVKARVKNLRSTFHQEQRKVKAMELVGRSYVPILSWYSEFKKIIDQGNKNNQTNNIAQATGEDFDDRPESSSCEEESELEELDGTEETNDPQTFVVSIKQTSLDNHSRHSDPATIELEPVKRQKRIKEEYPRHAEHKRPRMKRTEPKSHEIDEFQLFADNIAMQLRNMSLNEALQLQLDIQHLVAERRMNSKFDNNDEEAAGLTGDE